MSSLVRRVGVVCDYLEERWPSMDLVAAKLLEALDRDHAARVRATQLRPVMPRRLDRLPLIGGRPTARNVDRVLARFVDYPRWLGRRTDGLELFHIVDHSYAHLVHALPAHRTVITCHDLDTFRSVLHPELESRSWAFRAMTERILSGLSRAAFVACDSLATRDDILSHGLVTPDRLEVVYLGVDPVMSPAPSPMGEEFVARVLGPADGSPLDLVHVGSVIPRKRIDVLLRTFAAVRAVFPEARLIRVGGDFTAAQEGLVAELGLDRRSIIVIPFADQPRVAAVYRRAALVLQTSDAEGFGLPVAEAMACGVPVVASDLPVLREVGGDGAEYCPVGDIAAWSGTVCAMVRERREHPDRWEARRRTALREAARFSWSRFAAQMVDIYDRVVTRRRS